MGRASASKRILKLGEGVQLFSLDSVDKKVNRGGA
jgi:hypothetical protein